MRTGDTFIAPPDQQVMGQYAEARSGLVMGQYAEARSGLRGEQS